MKPVLIFRHVDNEGPGYLADFLDRHAIPRRLVKVDEAEPLPESLDDISGLVFMGGTMSVNDALPWIPPALALIREAVARELPVLGHCLGGQLIAKALGARVGPNPVPEFGWLDVELCNREAAADWLEGVPPRFPAFHWHGERFDLPPGAVHILKNDFCDHQGFVLGNTLALQCHIEMTAELVHDWIARNRETLPPPSPSIQSPEAMTEQLEERLRAMHRVADRFYGRWIRALG